MYPVPPPPPVLTLFCAGPVSPVPRPTTRRAHWRPLAFIKRTGRTGPLQLATGKAHDCATTGHGRHGHFGTSIPFPALFPFWKDRESLRAIAGPLPVRLRRVESKSRRVAIANHAIPGKRLRLKSAFKTLFSSFLSVRVHVICLASGGELGRSLPASSSRLRLFASRRQA